MAEVYYFNNQSISSEAAAIESLRKKLTDSLSAVEGKIWLVPSLDIHNGMSVHDVDLLMIGYLVDYTLDVGDQNVEFRSICTTIEIKSHDAQGVYKQNGHYYVKYSDGDEDVTRQSNSQKILVMNYLRSIFGAKIPFVTNLILLAGMTYDDMEESLQPEGSNLIASDDAVDDIFECISLQCNLRYPVDSFFGCSNERIEKIAELFFKKNNGIDTLTLRRINLLEARDNDQPLAKIEMLRDPIIVLSGHAGTGKTIMLLQAASHLSNLGKSCIYFTYNRALLSDLKHTMLYMPKELGSFKMTSMHEFMLNALYEKGLWKKNLDLNKDFIQQIEIFNKLPHQKIPRSKYDYVFVDEAQDWEKPVANALKKICRKSHIVIADGIDQFMRSSDHTDWGASRMPKLKICKRQRRNLTLFAKAFASKMGVYWDVEPNTDFPGGKVIITSNLEKPLLDRLMKEAKEHGCSEYDMMFLAPNSLTSSGHFANLQAYKSVGINLYDATNKLVRDKIYDDQDAKNKECRVYNYESCRGLEAWTTICMRFDELFTKPHIHDYNDISYKAARRYMLALWTLIPLTRPIGTLVLVVHPSSEIGGILKEIGEEYKDFVELNF